MTSVRVATQSIAVLCTFHRNGQWCGKTAEDEAEHVWPNERMRPGAHVWRHDPRDAEALFAALSEVGREPEHRSEDYRRGYQAGHQAGRLARRRVAAR